MCASMFRSRFVRLGARVKPSAKVPFHNHHRPLSLFPLSRPLLLPPSKKCFLIPRPPPFHPISFPPSPSALLPSPYTTRRLFSIPTPLQPPLIFTALLLALWFYKCVMLVLFQNRIIYMPSMPPFSRSERIADYAAVCRPVAWREERISAKDGTKLAVAVGEIAAAAVVGRREEGEGGKRDGEGEGKRVVIIYFQGNGSSLPPRLPALSSILKLLHQPSPTTPSPSPPIYTILALSYRGYWTSTGRPSEPGLILDAEAILAHAARTYPPSPTTRFVLWGQSLGASVALTAASLARTRTKPSPRLHGLILETPFLSIRAMLLTLYPQPWLPYRYLAPFLRNAWDATAALRRLAPPASLNILILQAARDELVPPGHAVELERTCLHLGFQPSSSASAPGAPNEKVGSSGLVQRVEIGGAFHTDVLARASGRRAVVEFLTRVRA